MFQEILTHLLQNKLRTALTGLSVSTGVFLLIFLLGAGNGLIHAWQNNMDLFATDVVNVWPGHTSQAYDGLEKNRRIQFQQRDVPLTQAALPQRITAAVTTVSTEAVTLSYGKRYGSASVTGVYPEQAHITKVKLTAGRYINDADMRERRKVVVITEPNAEDFFGSAAAAVGKNLRVGSLVYRIIGVRSTQGDFGENACHAPFTTVCLAYNKGVQVDQLSFRTVGTDTEEGDKHFQAALRRSLAARHRFHPQDETALWINNAATGAKENASAMNLLRIGLWSVGLLTLLSGVVGISNIMLITVKERTHEFGIRKALGARPWSILRSVLAESVLLTALFGYIGLVLGVAATEWLNYKSGEMVMEVVGQKFYSFLNPTVDLRIALAALAVLVAAGLVAGFFPARKAVSVKPIEALNAK